VEFALDDDQLALQQTVRTFLAERAPSSYVRGMVDDLDSPGISDDVWGQLVDLGWVGLLVPDAQGGAGMGLLEMMVVLEEMGRLPFPGPFLSSAVLATVAARRLGLDDRLTSLASGTTRGTVALDEEGHGDVMDRTRTRASRKSGQWRLTGTKAVVLDGASADWVLVPARTQQGIGTFVVESPGSSAGAGADGFAGLDVTRRTARLQLDDVAAHPVGPDGDHTAIWKRVADDAAVALCAETLGSMQQAFDQAVEYAKVRIQFDRPIATFQAIKHKAAEMLERIELSRVGVHYAAWASDVDDPVRAEAAAMAKSFVGAAANQVCGEAIQIYGGVGFTWECDAHLHYRRAKANDLLLGYSGTWARKVADSYLATG